MRPRNARFWVWHQDDYVKLTLTPSRPALETYHRSAHEEGWASRYTRWELSDGVVLRVSEDDGRDCDGRMSSSEECECQLDRLAAHEVPWIPGAPRLPDWELASRGQRDYSAEAAGY